MNVKMFLKEHKETIVKCIDVGVLCVTSGYLALSWYTNHNLVIANERMECIIQDIIRKYNNGDNCAMYSLVKSEAITQTV